MEWNFKNFIRNRLRKFLKISVLEREVDQINIWIEKQMRMAVDVNFHEQSQIIILSKLKGGQIHIIPVHFDHLVDLENFVERVKQEYKIKQINYWDSFDTIFNDRMKRI